MVHTKTMKLAKIWAITRLYASGVTLRPGCMVRFSSQRWEDLPKTTTSEKVTKKEIDAAVSWAIDLLDTGRWRDEWFINI